MSCPATRRRTEMAKREGHCLCGEVRFAAEIESEDMGACHCGMCRRWSGGPLVEVQAWSLEFLSGEPKVYRSSEWAERLFCPACGTHIAFRTQDGAFHAVGAGAFDPPLTGKLTMEVFIDEKPQGYAFAGDHKTMTGAEVMAAFSGKE